MRAGTALAGSHAVDVQGTRPGDTVGIRRELLALASALGPRNALAKGSLSILGAATLFLRRLLVERSLLDLLEEPILGADALETLQEAFARLAGPYGYLDRQTDVSDSS